MFVTVIVHIKHFSSMSFLKPLSKASQRPMIMVVKHMNKEKPRATTTEKFELFVARGFPSNRPCDEQVYRFSIPSV